MTEQTNTPESIANPFAAVPIAAAPQGAAAAAVVQREVAEVQSAMVIAKKFPRDPIAAMDRILQSCARPSLAHASLYQYSRGGQDISGPSIRLAEELARGWGNIVCGVTELTRHGGTSECLAYAWDLETNFRDEKRFQVKHWRDTKSGGYALKDERDIYEVIANQGARRKRACLLAVIPADVQEAAVQQCEVTLRTKTDCTPERVKSMVEKFGEFGVTQQQIEKRIQRRIDAMTPALMMQLGRVYNSLRDGMSQPGDWFESVETPSHSKGDAPAQPERGVAGTKEALRRKAGKAPQAESPPPTPAPSADAEAEALALDAQRDLPV
jgi:hypothetical protein